MIFLTSPQLGDTSSQTTVQCHFFKYCVCEPNRLFITNLRLYDSFEEYQDGVTEQRYPTCFPNSNTRADRPRVSRTPHTTELAEICTSSRALVSHLSHHYDLS
jgi:hypothetical protein